MDFDNKVIIAKGRNITFDVSSIKYESGKCCVKFKNGKEYNYNSNNVVILSDYKVLDASMYTVIHSGRELFNIVSIKEFSYSGNAVWRIKFGNGKVTDYNFAELEIHKSVLDDKTSADCLHYLSRMADLNDLTDEDGNKILAAQYKKVTSVYGNTVLADYLNPKNPEVEHDKPVNTELEPKTPIFPFGCNGSQYKAVANALSNNVSIIEGPPGTGKTQTILNIIANLIINGKTVQVVSNNNAATDNVLEKMASNKYGIDFIVARLGSKANKEIFLSNQSGDYPSFRGWKYNGKTNLTETIRSLSSDLNVLYEKQQMLAKTKADSAELETEFKHFKLYCDANRYDLADINVKDSANPGKIIKLIQRTEDKPALNFADRIYGLFFCKVGNSKFYKNSVEYIKAGLKYSFYISKSKQLKEQIEKYETELEDNRINEKERNLKEYSLLYLKDYLCRKYIGNITREIFTDEEIFKKPKEFLNEYPVILSTTFSALNSVTRLFDYVIIDESSQADISTGVLALCSAKNAVAVGDSCQLPFVLPDEKKRIAKQIFESYKLDDGYDFSKYSFLDSVKNVFSNAPVINLQEHYRCNPKIIGFCNQKFYDGNLFVMTEDNIDSPLSAIKTAPGNHARGKFNQRQIDVIVNEVLPKLDYAASDIGIIAPYNDQVNKLIEAVGNEEIKISTVHKFQGREKKVIIFCTVDNEIREFVDDPKLLNVAISRAEDKFILVIGNDSISDGNIADLVSYIEYNNLEVSESRIYSVFDMLYEANTEERNRFLSKHKRISEYDSENLMYAALTEMFKDRNELNVACHIPLGMLIRDRSLLTDRELTYVTNSLTHVDFLIYNKVSKKPVLIIEVDGYQFHKEGTRQSERDKIKDAVLTKYGIPFLRLSTIGSSEKEKIMEKTN